MTQILNPYTRRVLSDGRFPFWVPDEMFTRRDTRMIRRAAKKERARMLRLGPGEMTPVMQRYHDGCQSAQIDVRHQRAEHVRNVLERRARAEEALDRDPLRAPELQIAPPGVEPERQERLAAARQAIEAQKASARRAEETVNARIAIKVCDMDLMAIDHDASLMLDRWAKLWQTLFHLHVDAVVGGNTENPTLRHIEFTAYQLDARIDPLALDTQPIKAIETGEPNQESHKEPDLPGQTDAMDDPTNPEDQR